MSLKRKGHYSYTYLTDFASSVSLKSAPSLPLVTSTPLVSRSSKDLYLEKMNVDFDAVARENSTFCKPYQIWMLKKTLQTFICPATEVVTFLLGNPLFTKAGPYSVNENF